MQELQSLRDIDSKKNHRFRLQRKSVPKDTQNKLSSNGLKKMLRIVGVVALGASSLPPLAYDRKPQTLIVSKSYHNVPTSLGARIHNKTRRA
jgi:hypothetical protein